MIKISRFLLIGILIATIASCKKDKNYEDQLPPATQTGAGTFGCKINGKVYVPKGSSGTGSPNPHVQYDFDLNGKPYLSVEVQRFESGQIDGSVNIVFRDLTNLGVYSILSTFKYAVGWSSVIQNCGVGNLDTTVNAVGGGEITRLDVANHIISGTFDFKAYKPNCDTVRVTDGLFDIKF